MGQVYKAHDDRLGRWVAIKILPAHLSGRADLRQRFEQEARSISKLNHSHICSIFDVGEIDGTAYLVMELLEGETLADRISRGPLPTQQVLRYGQEIAEALEAAHRQHIVHRDLKPGNVMLTRSGVKLLDFGLAKIVESGSISGASLPPTVQKSLTAAGTVLGTLQYMAPEQLEAREVDARTDIFALGAVLYEMVTGKRAFPGNSEASIVAAILHSDPPPIADVQPLSPVAMERVIRPCLAKDPNDRWQTAGDVALQLKGLLGATTAESSFAPVRRGWRRWERLALLLSLLIAAAALATVFVLLRRHPPLPARLVHVSLILPDDQILAIQSGKGGTLAISRDGRRIVYLAATLGTTRLYVRSLDASAAVPLPGTDGAGFVFFSPDGNSVAFFADHKLKVLSLNGGPVADLCAADGPRRGGTWLDDGSIIFAGHPGAGLEILRHGSRKAEPLTTVAADEAGHVFPQVLPGDRFVMFVAEIDGKSFDEARISELDLQSGKTRTLISGGTTPVYAEPGRLFFVRDNRVLSTGIDVRTGSVHGAVSEVIRPVLTVPGTGGSFFDAARDGTIVYVPYTSDVFNCRLVWVGEDGKSEPLPAEAREFVAPRLSPDGRNLLVQVTGANDDLWMYDLIRGSRSRLTFNSENLFPVWLPDGKRLVFSRYRSEVPTLFKTGTDGAGEPEKILGGNMAIFPSSVSKDGKTVAFVRIGDATASDIGLVAVTGDHTPRMVVATRFNETTPEISPDGRWLAYVSNESGEPEVYAQPMDGSGRRSQISTNGGTEPLWSHRGTRLFYRSGDRLMSVAISEGRELTAGAPMVLFTHRFETLTEEGITTAIARDYDLSPDDRRFLFVEHDPAQPRDIRRLDLLIRQ